MKITLYLSLFLIFANSSIIPGRPDAVLCGYPDSGAVFFATSSSNHEVAWYCQIFAP
jgi:hypothetical protein